MGIFDEERRTFTEGDRRVLLTIEAEAEAEAEANVGVGVATEVGVGSPAERQAWLRLGDSLSRVLCNRLECGGAGPTDADPLVPLDLYGSPVERAIVLRVRTRDIRERVCGHATAVRRAFRVLDSCRTASARPGRTEALIALSLVAAQARCLGNRLTLLPPPTYPRPAALVAALGTALAESGRESEAAQGRLRAACDPDRPKPVLPPAIPCTAAFAAVASAVRLARCLEEEVRTEGIDASGADLSRLDLTDPTLLAGVIWSGTTLWPPRIALLLRSRSNRVAVGVYQVRRVYG
ncbi:hypothetical protein [Embleya sp. AB8]|uniref:hypothetical protein n=1 Tax=Embleya sp. AB8 TaxID=3156304 RepID=UPI003C70908C